MVSCLSQGNERQTVYSILFCFRRILEYDSKRPFQSCLFKNVEHTPAKLNPDLLSAETDILGLQKRYKRE